MATLGGVPAQAAPTDPPTVVSLTFDDGNADQLAAVPILDGAGMKGTFFITTGWIDYPSYLTRPQLTSLKAGGHEIGAHSVSHPDLTKQSTEETTKQVCQNRATLNEWGFPTRSFAYPFAAVNPAVEAAVAGCGFNSGRNLGDLGAATGLFAETVPPADAFQTRALDQVDSTWTLADLQKAVTDAEDSGGGWVQFTFHHVCATACDPLNLTITPELLQEFVTWLAPRAAAENTTVKTVGDVVGGATKAIVPSANAFPPAPAAGVNGVLNPSLETPGAVAGDPPQCWQTGGFGISEATFTTVPNARTGTAAMQLDVTSLASGDRKLAVTQDFGTCAPTATPGRTYSLRAWYTSTATTQFDVYYRNPVGGWIYWTSSPYFAAATAYTEAVWTTPPVPAGATGISFGLNLISVGTLVTDDYALYDSVGAPPAGGAGPVPITTSRLFGADRFATGVDISSKSYSPGVARVYVANAYGFADGLSASSAAAKFGGPLLLTAQNSMPANVRAEIDRLNPQQIVIVGGTGVVSQAVATQLQALSPVVKRLSGADRYATSRAIAADAFGTTARTAYLASGADFPDALSASPAAANAGGPTILIRGSAGTLDTATSALLTTLGVTTANIAGGTGVVSAGIENALKAKLGATSVNRYAGADRYATAAAINAAAFSSSATVYLASGNGFPDALVGAALAGFKKAPLYLSRTACLDAGAKAGISRLGATNVVLFGGTSVLSANVQALQQCG